MVSGCKQIKWAFFFFKKYAPKNAPMPQPLEQVLLMIPSMPDKVNIEHKLTSRQKRFKAFSVVTILLDFISYLS